MRVSALLSSSGFLRGSAFVVSCHVVYWCLPFSLVFSRLCCQLCCQLFPLGYSFVACLGFKWQAIRSRCTFLGHSSRSCLAVWYSSLICCSSCSTSFMVCSFV